VIRAFYHGIETDATPEIVEISGAGSLGGSKEIIIPIG
jgi:hypothetical protein